MAAKKPSVYHQGASIYVIGTADIQTAGRAAGINPDTHHWPGTDVGHYARRMNGWTYYDQQSSYPLPKDARPGVRFAGPIRRRDLDGRMHNDVYSNRIEEEA